MSEVSQLPSCILHQSITQPAIDRLSRDTNAAHSMLREHGVLIERMLLWKEESLKRITLLEQAAEVQRNESRRAEHALTLLTERVDAGLVKLDDRMTIIEGGVTALVSRLEHHLNNVKEEQLRITKEEAKQQRQQTQQHERRMRALATVAITLGAILSVLMMLHSAFSGVPIIDAVKARAMTFFGGGGW